MQEYLIKAPDGTTVSVCTNTIRECFCSKECQFYRNFFCNLYFMFMENYFGGSARCKQCMIAVKLAKEKSGEK